MQNCKMMSSAGGRLLIKKHRNFVQQSRVRAIKDKDPVPIYIAVCVLLHSSKRSEVG